MTGEENLLGVGGKTGVLLTLSSMLPAGAM